MGGDFLKDTDFLFLTSWLRAREVGMLGEEKINRMLEASGFDDAAKLLIDCGYPDMSEMSMSDIDSILETRRGDVFREIANYDYALDVLDLFRLKFDYHNVKVLVKSRGAKTEASHLLSDCGRVGTKKLSEAFASGELGDLPTPIAATMEEASGILARTSNPQLSDIEIDKTYYAELSALAEKLGEDFITAYVRLLIDSANLRITIRSSRTGRSSDFLMDTLIKGGSVGIDEIVSSYDEKAEPPFADGALLEAVKLGEEAMKGGAQTGFELACDNAVLSEVTDTQYISFGPAPVVAFLAKLEWEITTVRMILTGKINGISSDVIRERLRECHV